MQVYTGQVTSNSDPTRRGIIKVFCKDLDSEFQVYYTAPYHAVNEGGFFAPPVIGSYILFTGDLEKNEYYYISTIVGKLANQMHPSSKEAGNRPAKFQEIKEVNKIYGKATIPQQLRFTDHRGNGLLISNKHIKETKRPDLRTQLQTFKGKVVALNDSPEQDMINIETAHGDGIYIVQGKKNKVYGYRSINIKAKNSVNLTSAGLSINMAVVEGQEINIRNLSFGIMGLPGQLPLRQIGNVNIHSRWRDINIWTLGPTGAIIIRTPLARVQIEPNGRVYVAGVSVDINTAGSFNVNAGTGINLTSAGPINIKSATSTSLVGVAKIDLNNPVDIATMATAVTSLAPSVFSGYEVQS